MHLEKGGKELFTTNCTQKDTVWVSPASGDSRISVQLEKSKANLQ